MNFSDEVTIRDLPFCIGPTDSENNPTGLPRTLDLELTINKKYMVIEQRISAEASELLGKSYTHGIPMGTPSNDTPMGMPYVEDFINFISSVSTNSGRLLEIGAGTGYLSYRMKKNGWDVTSLEPGKGFESDWKRFGIEVVNDFYPSEQVSGKFETVIMYTVLEHMDNIESFLEALKNQLSANGQILLAVPDCSSEIKDVDPAMLIHEHISYFTETSLKNLFTVNGFQVQIEKSKFGRSIFVSATKVESSHQQIDASEYDLLQSYIIEIDRKIQNLNGFIFDVSRLGKIAVYCPARLLNILPIHLDYVFIDDDINIQGKHYPPFKSRVLSNQEISNEKIATVIIGSRTFSNQILDNLPKREWNIITFEELINFDGRKTSEN
jgi:2-polyprenyl-3-methyl-5-hydroxy-6-metoxy-1,4-benzoquinol methylase